MPSISARIEHPRRALTVGEAQTPRPRLDEGQVGIIGRGVTARPVGGVMNVRRAVAAHTVSTEPVGRMRAPVRRG